LLGKYSPESMDFHMKSWAFVSFSLNPIHWVMEALQKKDGKKSLSEGFFSCLSFLVVFNVVFLFRWETILSHFRTTSLSLSKPPKPYGVAHNYPNLCLSNRSGKWW
jgi:hypothetical protein